MVCMSELSSHGVLLASQGTLHCRHHALQYIVCTPMLAPVQAEVQKKGRLHLLEYYMCIHVLYQMKETIRITICLPPPPSPAVFILLSVLLFDLVVNSLDFQLRISIFELASGFCFVHRTAQSLSTGKDQPTLLTASWSSSCDTVGGGGSLATLTLVYDSHVSQELSRCSRSGKEKS